MNKSMILAMLFILNIHLVAMNNQLFECFGVSYTKNNFGDVFPLWQDIPLAELTDKLIDFVAACKDITEGAFIIQVPHNKALSIEAIRNAGFQFYTGNNDKTEWIIKNRSSIPDPYTAVLGAIMLVQKDDAILVVEEKTRKGFLGFPSGNIECGELPRICAARELKEEIGLNANREDFELIAVRHRVKSNRYGANATDHFYLIDQSKISGQLSISESEILRAFFVPMADIATKTYIEGLHVAPSTSAIIRYIMENRKKSRSEIFLDFRQLHNPIENQDQHDVMSIEFFSK